jgi:HPt (histidine-containing phosphotransfer) domain-containing protein
MKKSAVLLPVLILLLAYAPLNAEPPDPHAGGCPAHQASEQGFDFLGELHHVMAPAWHVAYPETNYVALGEAITKFDAMLPTLQEFSHKFKTVERQDNFNAARTQFTELVAKGKTASEAKDNTTLRGIFPDLHNNFEMMVFYLLPLDFPEYRSLRTVVDLMINTHLKNEDFEAIASSMGAIKIKIDALQNASLPGDLKSVEKKAAADVVAIGEMCAELESACRSTNTQIMTECLEKLKKLCQKFEQDYI